MLRNPLALLHKLTLERGLALTPQLCPHLVGQVLHPFNVTTSVLCLRPTYTALLADFGLPAAKFHRQAPGLYRGFGCLALADNPDTGHRLWPPQPAQSTTQHGQVFSAPPVGLPTSL